MWQRWNQSTHIFEKSDNDGATWLPLPLSGSIITEGQLTRAVMPTGTAYRDINNNFVAQTLAADSYISGGAAYLNFLATGAAADNQRTRIINYADGLFRIEQQNAAATVVSTAYWDRACNMYNGGNIQAGGILYDYGRSNGIGHWIQYSFPAGYIWGPYTITLTGVDYIYMFIGKTCFVSYYITATFSGAGQANYFYIYIPANAARTNQSGEFDFTHATATASIKGTSYTSGGAYWFTMVCPAHQVFANGNCTIRGTTCFQMQ
jgi:hypothetical protein